MPSELIAVRSQSLSVRFISNETSSPRQVSNLSSSSADVASNAVSDGSVFGSGEDWIVGPHDLLNLGQRRLVPLGQQRNSTSGSGILSGADVHRAQGGRGGQKFVDQFAK